MTERTGSLWRVVTLFAGVAGGAVLVIMGVLALVRGDIQGSWNDPIVEVNGWPHTPLLGLLEVIAGGALILVSLSSTAESIVGAAIAGFGIVALFEPEVLDDALTIESSYAWLLVAIGAVAVLSALMSYVGRHPARSRMVDPHTPYTPYSRADEYREEYVDASTSME